MRQGKKLAVRRFVLQLFFQACGQICSHFQRIIWRIALRSPIMRRACVGFSALFFGDQPNWFIVYTNVKRERLSEFSQRVVFELVPEVVLRLLFCSGFGHKSHIAA